MPSTDRTDAAPVDVWREGSYLIERYEHTQPDGVQWLVHRVKDGALELVLVCETRKEAALYVAGLSN